MKRTWPIWYVFDDKPIPSFAEDAYGGGTVYTVEREVAIRQRVDGVVRNYLNGKRITRKQLRKGHGIRLRRRPPFGRPK